MSQQITSPFFIRQLAEYVEKRVGRRLRQDELSWLRNFTQEHVPQQSYLNNIQLAQTVRSIGDQISRIISTHSQQREVSDVHGMLLDIMATDDRGPLPNEESVPEGFKNQKKDQPASALESFLGAGQQWLSIARNPASLYGVKHILLESSNRENFTETSTAVWAAYNNGVPPFGSFGYEGELQDIVAVRVYAYYTPLAILGDSFTFGLGFEEFAEQAFLGRNVVKFQFVLNSNEPIIDFQQRYKLDPFNNNRGLFQFYKPITRLSSLTMRMYEVSDSVPIRIVQDRLGANVDLSFANVILVINALNQPATLLLNIGDVVIVENYTPPASVAEDPFVAELTNPNGIEIIGIVILVNTVSIEVNVAAPVGAPAGFTIAEVLVPRLGFRIPIDFIYRRPEDEFVS